MGWDPLANLKGPQGDPGGAADIAAEVHSASAKTSPVDADELPLIDSEASFGLKRLTFASLKNWISGLTTAAANKLSTARTILTDLGSTSAASFDGSGNATPGITGTLGVANGGTGAVNAAGALANLGAVSKSGDSIAGDVSVTGNLLVVGGVLGFGVGSGGTVTQSTNKATAVALNKMCGTVVMNNAALAAGAAVRFSLFNSFITMKDVLLINQTYASGSPMEYSITAAATSEGNVRIEVKNNSGSSLSDALNLAFVIIKGASS